MATFQVELWFETRELEQQWLANQEAMLDFKQKNILEIMERDEGLLKEIKMHMRALLKAAIKSDEIAATVWMLGGF